MYSMWAHCTPQCTDTVFGSKVRIGCLAGINTQFLLSSAKGYLNLAQTIRVQEQSYCIQFGTFLGLFRQGDRIIKAILCLFRIVPGIWVSQFHPWDIWSEMCTVTLNTPTGCDVTDCQHCHKTAGWKKYEVSNWGGTLIIISCTRILLSLVMRQVLWPITDWTKLILQLNLKRGLGGKVSEREEGMSRREKVGWEESSVVEGQGWD